MSKLDLLNDEETVVAASQGWGLFHVYEPTTKKWTVQALGLKAPAGPETSALLVGLARNREQPATRALQLIMASYK